jgi:hypothetical protein
LAASSAAANLEDLRKQTEEEPAKAFQAKIYQSTDRLFSGRAKPDRAVTFRRMKCSLIAIPLVLFAVSSTATPRDRRRPSHLPLEQRLTDRVQRPGPNESLRASGNPHRRCRRTRRDLALLLLAADLLLLRISVFRLVRGLFPLR